LTIASFTNCGKTQKSWYYYEPTRSHSFFIFFIVMNPNNIFFSFHLFIFSKVHRGFQRTWNVESKQEWGRIEEDSNVEVGVGLRKTRVGEAAEQSKKIRFSVFEESTRPGVSWKFFLFLFSIEFESVFSQRSRGTSII